jgi:hypothetical protein
LAAVAEELDDGRLGDGLVLELVHLRGLLQLVDQLVELGLVLLVQPVGESSSLGIRMFSGRKHRSNQGKQRFR